MNYFEILGYTSTFVLALPVLVILLLRLYQYKVFAALGFYYSLGFTYNLLTNGYIPSTESFRLVFSAVNNMLEAPLVLFFLVYFSPSDSFTRKMNLIILALLAYALGVGILIGFNRESTVWVSGPGLLLVTAICIRFFIQKTEAAITNNKYLGKAIIIAGFLFAFVCYAFLYVTHYLAADPVKSDNFTIYFICTTISPAIVAIGILMEKNRLRELREIQVTRKELAKIYGEEENKKAAPEQAASVWKEEF